MSNPNTNCLAGMRCPDKECGSYGPFRIEGIAVFKVYDHGIEDYEDVEWTEKNVYCCECGYRNRLALFEEDEEDEA